MLDADALKAREKAQADAIGRWSAGAAFVADKALADALAHAQKALTDTLKATPDGRATIAKARQSRSFAAAVGHLDDLWNRLVVLVGDARMEFYHASYGYWRNHLPAEFHRSDDPEPRQSDLAKTRAAILHGMSLPGWLAGPIETAKKSLLAQLAQAASRGTAGADAADRLRAWAAQARRSIAQSAAVAINDSWTLADRRAGRDLVKPGLLHDDPTLG